MSIETILIKTMAESMILRVEAAGYGARTILHGVEAELPRASVTAVLGPGGSGKSTLLQAIAGSTAGLWCSGEIPSESAWLLPQPTRASRPADPRLVGLARIHLELWLDVHRGVLPLALHDALFSSEAAMFRVSQILAVEADLLLLDEPDALLDPLAGFALAAMLRARAREGTTIVLVTHSLALVAWVADHVLLLVDGVKIDEGPLERLLSEPASDRVRDFFTWGT